MTVVQISQSAQALGVCVERRLLCVHPLCRPASTMQTVGVVEDAGTVVCPDVEGRVHTQIVDYENTLLPTRAHAARPAPAIQAGKRVR